MTAPAEELHHSRRIAPPFEPVFELRLDGAPMRVPGALIEMVKLQVIGGPTPVALAARRLHRGLTGVHRMPSIGSVQNVSVFLRAKLDRTQLPGATELDVPDGVLRIEQGDICAAIAIIISRDGDQS